MREFLEVVRKQSFARGRVRGLFHIAIGRRYTLKVPERIAGNPLSGHVSMENRMRIGAARPRLGSC